jgi:hypothetical protein
MSVVITCTLCDSDLMVHCGHSSCTWLACVNRACEADLFDIDAGSLLRKTGDVERWA